MINNINQIWSVNIGLIVIETLIAILVLHYIISNTIFVLSKENFDTKSNRRFSLLSGIITSVIIIGIRFLLFNIFNDALMYFALSMTIYSIFYTLFFNRNISKNRTEENGSINDDNSSKLEMNMVLIKKFKKMTIIVISVTWIFALVVFFPIYSRISMGVESDYLSIANYINIDLLANSKLTMFCLGIEWAFITVIICQGVTVVINNTLPIQKKIPKKSLKDSMIVASIISFGIWGIQLIIMELYLNASDNYNIHQDIRLLIGVVSLIYALMFFLFLKIKFLPNTMMQSIEKLDEMYARKAMIDLSRDLVDEKDVVLEVKDLVTRFYTEEGIVKLVEGVSFKILEETNGLVGETGCGKSVTALSILQLVPNPGRIENGEIFFNGEDLLQKSTNEMLAYRGNKITMIFQDPLNSVNPVFKVGDQISEVILLHKQDELFKQVEENDRKLESVQIKIREIEERIMEVIGEKKSFSIDSKVKEQNELDDLRSEKEELENEEEYLKKYSSIYSIARLWAENLLQDVEIPDPEQIFDRYPHELSGGMRQRIMIAMALACSPKLLLADEPTTALDVTIQNQILQLMKDLRKKYHTSILFITHDLGIISKMCDRVAVMYSGYIVEYGDIHKLFKTPYHPYSKGLISSVPKVGKKQENLPIIPGMVPNLIYPPSGCRYHPRCDFCFQPCDNEVPVPIEVEPNYYVACHLYNQEYLDLAKIAINRSQK